MTQNPSVRGLSSTWAYPEVNPGPVCADEACACTQPADQSGFRDGCGAALGASGLTGLPGRKPYDAHLAAREAGFGGDQSPDLAGPRRLVFRGPALAEPVEVDEEDVIEYYI